MSQTPIPDTELEYFKSIPNCKVVFDVGARIDDEYIKLKPDIELHAFEPNPNFFRELKDKIGDRPNTYLNNFGLGDIEGIFKYNDGWQAFVGGENTGVVDGEREFEVKTIDWYVEKTGIKQIDFLKIDTEGYDYKVLGGAAQTIKMCRYIQYEHWNDRFRFHGLLEDAFDMTYIGGRNVFCKRRY